MHRIARQSVEVCLASDAAAAELHAELSASFRARMAPVLDEVFTAVCPPRATLRVDRLEIDVGVVPRDHLMDAIAAAIRQQLAALLSVPEGLDVAEPRSDVPQRLTEEEIALERLEAFLRYGTTTWRGAGLTRQALEATLLGLIESAPAALRRLLERLPSERVARRLWTQFTADGRHRLLAWLGVAAPAYLDGLIADWTAVLAALEDATGSQTMAATNRQIGAWVVEQVWTLILAGGRPGVDADAVGQRVLCALMLDASTIDSAALLELALIAAERLLPRDGAVRHFITVRASQTDRERRSDPEVLPLAIRPDAKPGEGAGDATAGEVETGGRGTTAAHGSPAEPERDTPRGSGADRHALSAAGARAADALVDDVRQRAVARLQSSRRERSAWRIDRSFGSEPLWVAHAGAVILWPFLPGFFDACGLTAAKAFTDDIARERAVLLTAHLASGLREWGEHDLLLEKTLCGYPGDAPIASAIELRDDELKQAGELLRSAIGHWAALKSTSVDGLRRAFLCRAGTMTAIASGWKLEIARAGHDVLLDTLPWGIGVVLLPWMEQPLHVEW